MVPKAFARACRTACLRFGAEGCGFQAHLFFSPDGLEKLRKRLSRFPEHETRTEPLRP